MSLIDRIRAVRGGLAPRGAPSPALDLTGERLLLVYAFPGMGDNVLLTPLLAALLDRYPGLRVGVLTRRLGARVLALADLDLELHELPEELVRESAPARAQRSARRRLLGELSRRRYTVAVDLSLRRELDARALLAELGVPRRLGWCHEHEDPDSTGLSMAIRDVRHHTDVHWSRAQLPVFRALGAPTPRFEVEWWISAAADREAERRWRSAGPRVAVVPGSAFADKRWPKESYLALLRHLHDARGASIAVIGAPWEAEEMTAIAKATGPRASVYTGEDLATLVALLDSAHLVVGNDTGPMHFAYLLRVPTLGIFTKMSPVVWGPPIRDERSAILNPGASAHEPRWIEAAKAEAERLLAIGLADLSESRTTAGS